MKDILLLIVLLIIVFSCSKKVTSIENYVPEPTKNEVAMVLPVVEEVQEEPEIITAKEELVIVYFDLNSSVLNEAEKRKLDKVSGKANLLSGCCPLGTDEYNYNLGVKRYDTVLKYLEKNGVEIVGYSTVGEGNLISVEPKEYYLNRRCEVRYIR